MWHSPVQPSLFVVFSCCSRYISFDELIHLCDLLDDVIFLLSTNQRLVTLFVMTHTPQTTTHGQQYMLSGLHLLEKVYFQSQTCTEFGTAWPQLVPCHYPNRSLHLDIDISSFEVKKLLAEQILGHVLFLYSYEIGSHIQF